MAIREIEPRDVAALLAQGSVFIDVREEHERASGQAEGALGIAKAELERDPAAHLPDPHASVVLICQRGGRSMDTARVLEAAGYTTLASVAGGTSRWREQHLAIVVPAQSDDARDFNERYSRHLLLPEVGVAGQQRLQQARVLMIGAGGLGSPAAFYGRGRGRAPAYRGR